MKVIRELMIAAKWFYIIIGTLCTIVLGWLMNMSCKDAWIILENGDRVNCGDLWSGLKLLIKTIGDGTYADFEVE